MKREPRGSDVEVVATFVVWILVCVAAGFMLSQIVIALAGCSPIKPAPTDPGDYSDPSGCAEACANLEKLGCPGWRGSPGKDETLGTADDVSCEEVCRNVVESGATTTLHQRCTSKAKSCEAMDDCFAAEADGW